MEEGDKWWLIEDLKTCKKLRFKAIDIVDISALPRKIWQRRLEAANVLLFEGGNTYHLMYWIDKSGLKDLLPELLETRVYVGISAESIVATPSLILSSAEKKPLKEIGDTIYDIRAAKKTKVFSIGITHDYHTKERLQEENPDLILDSLTGLLDYLFLSNKSY